MIPVLTKEQTYKLDKDITENGHFSKDELMDNAGRSVAQFFCEKIKDPFNQKVIIVCGKGNNGGDGIIAHSYLKKYNVSSKIVFTEKKHGHSKLIKKYKILKSDCSIYSYKTKFDNYDWIIDAIFGIGFSRKLSIEYKEIFENINNYNKNIISIDIPSGLYADRDNLQYNHLVDYYHKRHKYLKSNLFINSKHVITFGYPKLGHFLNPLESINIIDIGIERIKKCSYKLIESCDVKKILKSINKKKYIHKYSKGKSLIFAGSDIYPGAGMLSAKAAFKTGSGYVNLFLQSKNKNLIKNIDIALPNIVVESMDVSLNYNFNSPLLVGPGDVRSISLLTEANMNDLNIVIDAQAMLDWEHPTLRAIYTPHIGEFRKMFKIKNNCIDDKILNDIQKKCALRIIILKSFNTFIITEDMIYIMDKGPSLLATAGTGDVLSGILVSLLSQGYSRLEASILGTYLHAEAANYYMNNISKDGMTASDLIDCIPYAFNRIRKND